MSRHIHFDAQLAAPPLDRPRLGVRYPAVAQKKGISDRLLFDDLNWKKHLRPEHLGPCPGRSTATQTDASDVPNARTPEYRGSNGTVKRLLLAACESLLDKTAPCHDESSQKPTRPNLDLLMPNDSNQASTLNTPGSSAYGSSSSSSFSTTPSGDTEDVQPWR